MLTVEQVDNLVKSKATKFATVSFIKKDGTKRVINGLFRAKSHIKGNDGGKNNETMKKHGLIAIYSLKDKGWRCFNKNSVVAIK